MTKSKKRRITIFLEGGTGNQLFMYFAGLSAALNLNSELVLETKYIGKYGTNHGSFLDKVELQARLETNSHPRHLNALLNRFINALARRSSLVRYIQENVFETYRSIEVGYDPKIFQFSRSMKIFGYFQSWKYFEFCLSKNQANIQLVDPSEIYLDKQKLIIDSPTIAVHVRRGDYGPLSNSFGLLDESYYVKAVDYIFSEYGAHKIWVFSDEINDVKLKFQNEIWKDALFTNFNLNPMETIFLMAEASSRVISNSSFSYWSALLSRSNDRNVAPSPWFRSLEGPKDLLPPEWKTLGSTWLN
jgi:hypothetical protein